MNIRKARQEDVVRIAEIFIFNYRLNFYPIFRDDTFYFEEFQVPKLAQRYESDLDTFWVYDDGVVKGFTQVAAGEVKKLFVEPVLQGQSIGGKLLDYAVAELGASTLWALEKNEKAIAFYERHGFRPTGDREFEDGSTEYLIRLAR